MRALIYAAAALLAGLLISSPAFAANGAAFSVIGYSPDSRYFAFEQYGFEDGSGAAYWEISIIDLEKDEWVQGTPARVRLENEEETTQLSQARAKAMETAAPLLKEKNITEPSEILAANPATEVVADRSRIVFDPYYTSMGAQEKTAAGGRQELVIDAIPLPQSGGCTYEDSQNYGFKLTIRDIQIGSTRTLHQDKSIPASRNCPFGYDIMAVVAHAGFPVINRHVAIIGVYGEGWEGADHRFIAVPFVLSD